ncbi:hypothetical protein D3C75_936230 [compost metagenome]
MPGPGKNGIYPKGFEEAALMTSHTLIPILSHIRAISFTKAIFTLRNVFSSNLDISATLGEETVITVFTVFPYKSEPSSAHFGVVPPITFGVL